MKNITRNSLAILLVLGAPLSASAQAVPSKQPPVVVDASDVQLNALLQEIERSKKPLVAEFAAVKQLREEMPELDARKRGRIATVGTTLDLLGPKALFPMLEELALDRPFEKQVPSVRQGWRIGLLHAVGRLRDERARPILEKVVRTEQDAWVLKTAAEALGKLQDERAAQFLITESQGSGERAEAILEGMAHCRRLVVTQYLTSRLAQATEQSERRALVESLRDHGNSYAWKTDVVAASGEGTDVRNLSAQALLSAFVRFPAERPQIQKALLIVDAPATTTLLQTALKTTSDKAAQEALQGLQSKLANNPLHAR
jgi:HEAT repeat protein